MFGKPTSSQFTLRTDEFSSQVMAKDSTRFLIRIISPKTSKTTAIFSDFILDSDDNERAVEALSLLEEQGFRFGPSIKLVFQDIHPSFRGIPDREELIRRHDQIVTVIKGYAVRADLSFGNAFLEPKAGKFETIILIE